MWFKNKIRLFGLILLFLIVNMSISACDVTQSGPRPNIVSILTDDMDSSLMPYLENTNELIGKNGATFTNYFVTSSLCCPSRASMLRGQYPHNTDVLSNNFPEGGFRRFFVDGDEAETLAVWLNREGYQTSLIGKYLNGYPVFAGSNYVPAGWTDWHALFYKKRNEAGSFYNDYILNENGPLVEYGGSVEEYSTDVFKQKSIDFIEKSTVSGDPFFLLISVYAPHGPSTPALRHAEMLADQAYPQKPSFNETDISDKPGVIQDLIANGDEIDTIDADVLFQQRAKTLLAVDELVVDVIAKLEQSGQLENTYIFFMSDNGFHIGEHGLSPGKGLAYEEDIHVPLLIRGPGIAPNTIITQLTANIDLAPTIADMTRIKTADFIDGRSLMPLFQMDESKMPDWRKALLIEMGAMTNASASSFKGELSPVDQTSLPFEFEFPDSPNDYYLIQVGDGTYRGIRTDKFMYVEYNNGETEFYDLIADPYQLENLSTKLEPAILASLHIWLEQLQTCTAKDCKTFEDNPPVELENYP